MEMKFSSPTEPVWEGVISLGFDYKPICPNPEPPKMDITREVFARDLNLLSKLDSP